jgi:hypothetical protein
MERASRLSGRHLARVNNHFVWIGAPGAGATQHALRAAPRCVILIPSPSSHHRAHSSELGKTAATQPPAATDNTVGDAHDIWTSEQNTTTEGYRMSTCDVACTTTPRTHEGQKTRAPARKRQSLPAAPAPQHAKTTATPGTREPASGRHRRASGERRHPDPTDRGPWAPQRAAARCVDPLCPPLLSASFSQKYIS